NLMFRNSWIARCCGDQARRSSGLRAGECDGGFPPLVGDRGRLVSKLVRLISWRPRERSNRGIGAWRVSSQALLPGECVSDDGGEIIVPWCPPQRRAGAIGSRDDLGWIARPARCDLDLEIDTRDALDHLNHLTHRETMTIAAIERH